MSKFVLGIDFGTDSVRVLLVGASTGKEMDTAVCYYPRWMEGKYCDASVSQYRQHPMDYLYSMETAIKEIITRSPGEIVSGIVAISVDTTGSTPVAVDRKGIPLALHPEFSDNPNAMFVLWKDHTANAEAEEINALAHHWSMDYTRYSGGIYSSEWFWSKILHIVRADEVIREHAFSWVEHCDWIPALLTGQAEADKVKRSRCAAGHKALWHESFDGLPSEKFLCTLDKRLAGLRQNLYHHTDTSDQLAGTISKEWALRLGLPEHILVGVGCLDAHAGAVGANIQPYTLVKVIGTSTCDMLIAPQNQLDDKLVRGICGQVDGSIIPGMIGMEAGQSAFGDLYAWFQELLAFPLKEVLVNELSSEERDKAIEKILPLLSEKAAGLPVSDQDMVALDWINGRRTPDADLTLRGTITGLRLGSSAAHVFKALVEATAFGSRAIIQRFEEEDIRVKEVIALGGITKKSAFVMQTLANVLAMPIRVVKSEQACALGAAMYAATVAGVYANVEEAQRNMSSGFETSYEPEQDKVKIYERLYQQYNELGNYGLGIEK